MKPLRVLFNSNYKLDYRNYFPNREMTYDGVEFVTEADDNIDAVIICNHAVNHLKAMVAPENVFHVHQEPGDKLYHGFMFNPVTGKKCGHLALCDINSHPSLNWLVDKTFDELTNLDTSKDKVLADKTELFSGVISGHNALQGHYFRLQLLDQIKQAFAIDLYGKRHNFIPDKWDALYPYKFSLAMENSRQHDYWTEKIMDCFLACTMPVYYGCKNIDKYFPKQSYIEINADNMQTSLAEMKEKLTDEYFAESYDYILEARELCLTKYSTAPGLSNIVKENFTAATKQQVVIPAFKRSVMTDIKRKLLRNRWAHKLGSTQ